METNIISKKTFSYFGKLFLFFIIANLLLPITLFSQVKQEWVNRYNGVLYHTDNDASVIVTDNWGNIYVAGNNGTSIPIANNREGVVTIKYNSDGIEQWKAWCPYYGIIPKGLAVDDMGNVYVVARIWSGSFVTVKYSSSGEELWKVKCVEGDYNISKALVVDSSGNIYVIFELQEDSGNPYHPILYNYATVKYDSSGNKLWLVKEFPDYYSSSPNDIAVDSSGNVYVTGESDNDYGTVKYNSAGEFQWSAKYNYSWDAAKAIAVDFSGNVYVTGISYNDIATIKYDSNGIEQWVSRYYGPTSGGDSSNAMAIDNSGNIYITGKGDDLATGFDYLTIKYNNAGVEQWIARYNGPGNGEDVAEAIKMDAFGNIYVTGKSTNAENNFDYATIKYNNAGIEQWVTIYDGKDSQPDEAKSVAIDNWGNTYVTGQSFNTETDWDYATIKYNWAGAEQWVVKYEGQVGYEDSVTDITVDNQGNIYATGKSKSSDDDTNDCITMKISPAGATKWVTRYNSTNNGNDGGNAIATDNFGNVYITGKSGEGILTIKYNSLGTQQWLAIYPGAEGRAIVLDNLGNVFIAGIQINSGTGYDAITIKYNDAGQEQWVAVFNGPDYDSDGANDLAVDSEGNVYITGWVTFYGNEDKDYLTIKYNSMGVQQWLARYNGPINMYDIAKAIVLDDVGNVYVTGSRYNGGVDYYDFTTIKYNNDGEEQWVAVCNRTSHSWDVANDIALDNSGNVFVTGNSGSDFSDYTTIKYDNDGVIQWVGIYNGPGNINDEAWKIKLDSSDNVYVTGWSENAHGYYDFATVKYNNAGSQQWVMRYDGPAKADNRAYALAIDLDGNVYVGGTSIGLGTDYDCVVVKYSQPKHNAEVVDVSILQHMYPNKIYYGYVEMKNTGSEVWTSEGVNPYRLGAVGDYDDLVDPGQFRIELEPGETIAFGETKRFDIVFTPDDEDAQKGSVTTEWRMLQEHIEWFGETASVTVSLTTHAGNWEIFE